LDPEDVIAILENTIHLLMTYEKYHISIIKNNFLNQEREEHIYCLAKERQGVLIEIYKPPQTSSVVRLLIKEPMVVTAIVEYFRQYWNQIAPVMKDKKEVIAWLHNEVDLLKSKLIGQR
ncbi:MAG: XRE family transcriptional regulator, partial [Desulfitobacterium sp.]|nr:XRE family transcriptional regulator [Desulfitobacterium sp.]